MVLHYFNNNNHWNNLHNNKRKKIDKKYELKPGVFANKEQQQAIDMLQDYLAVDINILKRASRGPWYEFIVSQELNKLQEAYFIALGFFGENINEL